MRRDSTSISQSELATLEPALVNNKDFIQDFNLTTEKLTKEEMVELLRTDLDSYGYFSSEKNLFVPLLYNEAEYGIDDPCFSINDFKGDQLPIATTLRDLLQARINRIKDIEKRVELHKKLEAIDLTNRISQDTYNTLEMIQESPPIITVNERFLEQARQTFTMRKYVRSFTKLSETLRNPNSSINDITNARRNLDSSATKSRLAKILTGPADLVDWATKKLTLKGDGNKSAFGNAMISGATLGIINPSSNAKFPSFKWLVSTVLRVGPSAGILFGISFIPVAGPIIALSLASIAAAVFVVRTVKKLVNRSRKGHTRRDFQIGNKVNQPALNSNIVHIPRENSSIGTRSSDSSVVAEPHQTEPDPAIHQSRLQTQNAHVGSAEVNFVQNNPYKLEGIYGEVKPLEKSHFNDRAVANNLYQFLGTKINIMEDESNTKIATLRHLGDAAMGETLDGSLVIKFIMQGGLPVSFAFLEKANGRFDELSKEEAIDRLKSIPELEAVLTLVAPQRNSIESPNVRG